MNYQFDHVLDVIRVMIINPLVPEGQLIASKILSGIVFGGKQMIDLILLVYSNELESALELKQELISCAHSCYNSITVTSDLPTITDADVFCFLTNLDNPNMINYDDADVTEQFDTIYLVLKIASNFSQVSTSQVEEEHAISKRKKPEAIKKIIKPIIFGDGLVVIDILKCFTNGLPPDIFFCTTTLSVLGKIVVTDYLKIINNELSDPLVWAANNEIFHLELEDPNIFDKAKEGDSSCGWDSRAISERFHMDFTQFNPSWLKKDMIEKVGQISAKNPYGCFNKAVMMCQFLNEIWKVRFSEAGTKLNKSVGVISDGSLGTIKGLPYVLPLTFTGDSWVVNRQYEEQSFLQSELKRINKTAKQQHDKLLAYCKKFREENVINMAFVPAMNTDTDSLYTLEGTSFSSSTTLRKKELTIVEYNNK